MSCKTDINPLLCITDHNQSITSQRVFLLLHPVRQRKISRVWAASALRRFYSRRSPAAARWRKPPHIYSTKTRLIQPVREWARDLDREHGSDFMSTEETSIRIWNMSVWTIPTLPYPVYRLPQTHRCWNTVGQLVETVKPFYCAFIQHFYITKVSFRRVIIYCPDQCWRDAEILVKETKSIHFVF